MEKDEIRLVSAIKYWIKNTEDGFHEDRSYNELQSLIEERAKKLKKKPTEVKFGPTDLEDHYTCYYCGLADKKVEAGGVWHCPNFTCTGPGGHYNRTTLSSYSENSDSTHSVDFEEWAKVATAKMEQMEESPIKEAMRAGVKKLRVKMTSEKMGL